MISKFNLSVLSAFMFICGYAISQDTTETVTISIGERFIDHPILKMTKNELVEAGKLTVNQKGYYVKGFYYSTFALGKSVREYVADSIFPESMKKVIFDKKNNYHHINLEQIEVYSENGKPQKPGVETVKIKFLNK